ncbi:MAG: hypothetical protein AAFZ15_17830 [Bacteroidota bacterium]
MRKIFFLFLLASSFFACDDEEDVITFFELSCLGDASPPINQLDCDDIPSSTQICEAGYVGEFSLEEESRSFIPQFCRNIGDVETYVNGAGDTKELTVSNKSFFQSRSVRNTFVPCENDSSQYQGACFNFELGMLTLVSEPDSLELTIQLKTVLSKDDYSGEKFGDVVEILRKKGLNTFIIDFSVVVNERTLGYPTTQYQENLGEVVLIGASHVDVISSSAYLNFPNSGSLRYYYNKWKGLVAFEDADGVLWRLEE